MNNSFERRDTQRRRFPYYMKMLDDRTQQLVGHLSDISARGFKLDCPQALPLGRDYRLRLELTSEIADKSFMVFTARSRWCRTDEFDPFVFNVGFEIVTMAPSDTQIYQRIIQRYSSER
jgi:PilZ domain-containing protein